MMPSRRQAPPGMFGNVQSPRAQSCTSGAPCPNTWPIFRPFFYGESDKLVDLGGFRRSQNQEKLRVTFISCNHSAKRSRYCCSFGRPSLILCFWPTLFAPKISKLGCEYGQRSAGHPSNSAGRLKWAWIKIMDYMSL